MVLPICLDVIDHATAPIRIEYMAFRLPYLLGPSGAMAAQPICNWQVGGFESPLGLQKKRSGKSLICFIREGYESRNLTCGNPQLC